MSELAGLYVAIDPTACRGRDPVAVAEGALRGGAKVIQWRDKTRDKGDQLPEARSIYALCRQHDATFILNDHADMALILASEMGISRLGLHLGQHDLPITAVRPIVPAELIIGVSTNNPDEALAAERDGATYIAVGDIFGTQTKEGTRAASPERLAEVKAAVGLSVFGIGGINRDNLGLVMRAGASGVAVISAVCAAEDPEAAARELVAAMEKSLG